MRLACLAGPPTHLRGRAASAAPPATVEALLRPGLRQAAESTRTREAAKLDTVKALLPVVDSFELARGQLQPANAGEEKVDKAYQAGPACQRFAGNCGHRPGPECASAMARHDAVTVWRMPAALASAADRSQRRSPGGALCSTRVALRVRQRGLSHTITRLRSRQGQRNRQHGHVLCRACTSSLSRPSEGWACSLCQGRGPPLTQKCTTPSCARRTTPWQTAPSSRWAARQR